ncbi:hypothetical protein ACWD0Z_04605 [Streptomyces sp. NPDC003007]
MYLAAQCCLLGLIITAVHVRHIDVPPAVYLVPWLGVSAGGVIGMSLELKKPNQP